MKIKRINGKPAIAMTAKSGSFLFLAPPLGRELYDLNEIDTTNVAHLKRSERTRQERKNKKTRELHDTTVTTLQIKNHDRIPSDILKSLPSNGNLLVQGYFEEDVPVLARPLCANDQRFPKVLEVGIPDRVQGKSIQHETDLITLGYMFEDDVIEDNQFEEKFVRIDNGLFAPTGKDAPSVVEEKELKENEENFLSSIVNQTQFHNCFFLAAVEALLLTQGMEYFKKRMTDNGDGTTTVTLYHPTSATKKKEGGFRFPHKV